MFQKYYITPEEAWKYYRTLDIVKEEGIVFGQFEVCLKGHRSQVNAKLFKTTREIEAYHQYLHMNPQEIHNKKGQLIFDRSSAKPFLRKDIKDEKHKIMSPRELQASRAEYAPFDSDIFGRRIYQEVCRKRC